MNSFKDKFRMFMQGRYGMDELGKALLVLYIVLCGLNIFFRSRIIHIVIWVVLLVFLLRALSRNTAKRYDENVKFQNLNFDIRGFADKMKSRFSQNQTHCFKRCPNCGKTLRLPRKRGKHGVKCPVCGCKFSVTVWFGDK